MQHFYNAFLLTINYNDDNSVTTTQYMNGEEASSVTLNAQRQKIEETSYNQATGEETTTTFNINPSQPWVRHTVVKDADGDIISETLISRNNTKTEITYGDDGESTTTKTNAHGQVTYTAIDEGVSKNNQKSTINICQLQKKIILKSFSTRSKKTRNQSIYKLHSGVVVVRLLKGRFTRSIG